MGKNLASQNKTTLQIKEEQLDIAKKWIQTGDVKIHKEVFSEEKNFTIPIQREELVIEKKSIAPDTSKSKAAETQVIRIPLNEEQVEFSKHKVILEDISIYKQQIEDIEHIEETLKKEKPKVKISGSPNVINKLS
ncbi:YsnF/AvaK domain-containing protein [Clostridium guangxiense]|uniref:YsnF/AvaK domain-containing protein n=1 Tax=Clostridium guangxiense TaxID=1662055 RepID=UPI001E5E9A20|nr:YsnF/AvaK domain-containing protein [Clostridium guangxiense]MCD2349026.1 YsnF/AvaK domain-containing protein [Clostridium guangxiense]